MKKATGKKSLFIISFIMLILVLGTSCSGSDLDSDASEAPTEEELEAFSISIDEESEPTTEEYSETAVEEYVEPPVEAEDIPEEVDEVADESGAEKEDDTSDENGYTFTEMATVMYASSGLNVRDIPDQSGNSLGKLKDNEELSVTGQCNETGWYRIDYSGGIGYVSNDFVSKEKKEVAAEKSTVADTATVGADTATTGAVAAGSAGTVAATTDAASDSSGGAGSGNGSNFDTYNNTEQQQTSASYVLNTNTKKFHVPSCASVAKIAPQNYATANDRASILEQGYEPCKKCNP